MRVLIYKRTHTGDPDQNGVFGVRDCMGKVRGFKYDAVLGVGGVGGEPVCNGIDRKITWIGISPRIGRVNGRGPLVTFDHFLLFDENGPEFGSWAPSTAERFYGQKVRYVMQDIDLSERGELQDVIAWATENAGASKATAASTYRGFKVKCISRPPLSKKKLAC
jgi:hypothetical protein